MKLPEQSHAEQGAQTFERGHNYVLYERERRQSETSRKVKHALYNVYSPRNQLSIENVCIAHMQLNNQHFLSL